MNIILKYLKYIISRLFPKKIKPIQKRRERIRTLWPTIQKDVAAWEQCFSDKRIGKETVRYYHDSPEEILKQIYNNIPVYGAYCASENMEIRKSLIDCKQVDVRACKARSFSLVIISKELDKPKDKKESLMFNHGITTISAVASSKLPEGWYAMNTGLLYEISLSHWTISEGHALFYWFVVIDNDGYVHPLHQFRTEITSFKSKKSKGMTRIPRRGWVTMTHKDCGGTIVATWFNFALERNAHWNCTVRSSGVPPIAFPVTNHDIARVFPSRQRDGKGKIVHWTRTHKRKTSDGFTNVKAHIRGNTWWNVDDKQVRITLPGKHHGMPSETAGVVVDINEYDSSDSVVIDPITGCEYTGCTNTRMIKLLSRARISQEEITLDRKKIA